MNPIYYSLGVWWLFYMINHAEITEKWSEWLFDYVGVTISYSLKCAFCLGWWVTIPAVFLDIVPWWYIFCAPVVNIFLNLAFVNLCKDHPRNHHVKRPRTNK